MKYPPERLVLFSITYKKTTKFNFSLYSVEPYSDKRLNQKRSIILKNKMHQIEILLEARVRKMKYRFLPFIEVILYDETNPKQRR